MVLASLAADASVARAPNFDDGRFFSWLDACRPTRYVAGLAMHQAILAQAAAHPAAIERRPLQRIRSGASPLPPRVLRELELAFGTPVIEAYGLTEAAPPIACNPLPLCPHEPGSVGLAAGMGLAILGEQGAPLLCRATGEVAARGPNIMVGYESDEEANRRAFVEGWLRTSDRLPVHHRVTQGGDRPRRPEDRPARDRRGAPGARRRGPGGLPCRP